MHDS
ncbi:uncharacterized protein FFM5_15343 [Fusarium fujikuroi]